MYFFNFERLLHLVYLICFRFKIKFIDEKTSRESIQQTVCFDLLIIRHICDFNTNNAFIITIENGSLKAADL